MGLCFSDGGDPEGVPPPGFFDMYRKSQFVFAPLKFDALTEKEHSPTECGGTFSTTIAVRYLSLLAERTPLLNIPPPCG
jgi:hypothetical protein